MLTSVALPVERGAEALRALRGDLVHRYVLALIQARDPALSAALHRDARHKPFTAALLPDGRDGGAVLRLTALDAEVSAHLDLLHDTGNRGTSAARPAVPPFICEGGTFALGAPDPAHRLARRIDTATLWQRHAQGPPPPPRARLRFLTPTAFDSPEGLFPLPALVFSSLARKWARHAELALDEGEVEELATCARVVRHELRSARVPLGRFHATGFVGECDLALPGTAPPELARLLHLLAAFAFYAGVGLKTTMGMGQVRPGPVRREDRR